MASVGAAAPRSPSESSRTNLRMIMDRRRFLRVSAATAFAGLAGAGCAADAGYDVQALAEPELVSVLGPDDVREIGVRYRELVPAEDDVDALHAAIRGARPWTSLLPGTRRVPVEEVVREEFAEGRTVLVNGWVLSATEARQCALYSLLRS